MGALYALLGLVFGIAIAEAVRWRVGGAGVRHPSPESSSRRSPVTQPASGAGSSSRFTAREYYDH